MYLCMYVCVTVYIIINMLYHILYTVHVIHIHKTKYLISGVSRPVANYIGKLPITLLIIMPQKCNQLPKMNAANGLWPSLLFHYLFYEWPHGKTNNLHRRKQRHRSASE